MHLAGCAAAVPGGCYSAASRPCATAETVRSSPPSTQSPPAQTLGERGAALGVDLDAAGLQRDAAPLPLSAASKLWPIALNTWSAAMTPVSPVPASLPSRIAVYSSSMPATLPSSAMTALRLQPVADDDAVGGGQILLELGGVHVLLAAAVADRHLLGAEQLRLHGGVDRRHAAADDDDAAADRQMSARSLAWRRSAMKSTASLDAVGVLALGAQRVDAAKPDAEEHRVVLRSQVGELKSRPSALPFCDLDAADRRARSRPRPGRNRRRSCRRRCRIR